MNIDTIIAGLSSKDLHALAKRALLADLTAEATVTFPRAAAHTTVTKAPRKAAKKAKKATSAKAPKHAFAPTKPRVTATVGRSAKRSSDDILEAKAAVLAFVKANPGCSAEQIKAATGLGKAVVLPIKQLVESKDLKRTGERRGTKYSLSSKSNGAALAEVL